MRALIRWFTHSGFEPQDRPPGELIILRSLGVVYLALFIFGTIGTRPHPGFHGKGLAITAASVAIVVFAVGTMRRGAAMPQAQRIVLLLGISAASASLAALQGKGIWQAGPYFVVIIAAATLERRAAVATAAVSLTAVITTAAIAGHGSAAISLGLGVPPWFFVMRLIRILRTQHDALKASQAAEARVAAEAERGRLSREMHDVLAHSLSALALQLESARLLARDRHTDPDVTESLDRAHHLAAQGLDEARRAIAAARGEPLHGPEHVQALADAFQEQSTLPVNVSISGEPRELAPDAQVAIYRVAQEALTNVRKHAAADSVEVRLDYGPDATILVIEDRGVRGTPPAVIGGGGYGLTGMRERAELLGGRLTAGPTAVGFRVELRLPVAQPAPTQPAATSRA